MSEHLQTYSQFRPTGFDVRGLGLEDRQSWYVAPCSRTRDAGILEESNFETMIKCLEAIDPDNDDHEIHSFNHWACGWFEIVIVRPGSACQREAEEIVCALADYPVLDDSDHSEREYEAACEAWQFMDYRDRIKLCSEHGASIFAARRDEIPDRVPCYALTE